jgi:hypothetical protein
VHSGDVEVDDARRAALDLGTGFDPVQLGPELVGLAGKAAEPRRG